MIDPETKDLGRSVLYKTRHCTTPEPGILSSFNPMYVFVLFRGAKIAVSCRRQDLEWAEEESSK